MKYEWTCPVCGKVKKTAYKREVRTYCSVSCSVKDRERVKREIAGKCIPGECIFQPESIICGKRDCGNCGWNPVVAKARLEAIKEKLNETYGTV